MSLKEAVRKIGTGTIGGPRNPLEEGTPDEIRAAHIELQRKTQLEAARAKNWIEYQPDELERVRNVYLDEERNLVLELVRGDVWASGDPRWGMNDHLVCGWFVGSDGYPVFLQRPSLGPTTVVTFRAQEATRRHKVKAAALDRKAALITTPLEPVTLAELQGVKSLPTLKEAVEIVTESAGKLEVVGDRLRVHLRVRKERELDATRVLYAAEPVVVEAVKAAGMKGKTPTLPDKQVLAGGGIA